MTVEATAARDAAWTDEAHARRRLLGGGAWGAADFALSVILGLPLTIVLVRVLPRHVYGSLATAMSVCFVLGSIVSIGLADSLARTLAWRGAARPDNEVGGSYEGIVATAWRLVPVAAALGVALTVVVALALSGSRVASASALVLIGLPLVAMSPLHSVLIGLVRVSYRPGLSFVASVTASALALFGTIAVLLFGARSAAPVMVVRVAAAMAGVGLMALMFRRTMPARGAPSRATAQVMLRIGGAVMLVSVAAIAISQLDVLSVGVFKGAAAAGVYAPLSRLLDVVTGAFAALGTYALVALSSAGANSTTALARQYHWCTRWTLVALGPALAALLVAPLPIVHLLFGTEPPTAATVVRIIAAAACVHVVLGYNGLSLVALGESKLVLLQGGIALAVSAAACVILVPLFGLNGAASATALSLVASNVVSSLALWRRHGIRPMDRPAAVTVATFAAALSACLAVALLVGDSLVLAAATVAVVGVLTFVAAMSAGGGWRGEEMVSLRAYAGRLRHAAVQSGPVPP
jgi:O-antigen/teichoic acid export membrane protein